MSREKGQMQPFRDRKKITEMKEWLLRNKGIKYSFLFVLGVNTGLRISDLLRLKVSDVRNRSIIYFEIKKTGRVLEIPLNPFIQSEIGRFVEWMGDNDYLFQSREGVNRPLTRQMISQNFKAAAAALGLENFNTHSMRKTFGYWYYRDKKDVYFLMKLFGHNTQSQTLDYIGILSDELVESLKDFSLGDD